MLVCTLGDLTLDVVVRPRAALAVGGDTDAEIRLGPGGQAANVAAWAAALGDAARFIGKTGADGTGQLARAGLGMLGVEVVGPVEGRNAVICSLVSADGERSLASDRGAAADLRAEELEPEWFAGCEHLFVSGYALVREPARGAAIRAAGLARGAGAAVGVDLSSSIAIRHVGADVFRAALDELEPDVVFANEEEDRVLGGPIPSATWIVKHGPRGCTFDGVERPALPVGQVVDSTGAGDALAAGWIVGGPDLALEAAARCVSRLGSVP